ncbi:MAG: alpha/beta hydrolase, partial [Polyangiales bacterium]
PVLMLHGGLGTLEDFNPLVDGLASRRLIAVDARGHGGSTLGTQPLSYARLEADVLALAQALGLARFALLGFSDGGIVALRIAASQPQAITKLAVLGTPYRLTQDDPLRARLASVTSDSWRQKFPQTAETYERLNPAPAFDALVRASVPMWIDLGPKGYPGDRVKTLEHPTLVARGDDDPLVTRAATLELVEQLAHGHLLNVPFAGHELHKDQPTLVGAILDQFLRSA